MATNGYEPYVAFKPGDLIAAEVMNDMQSMIRADISTQTQTAVDNIAEVPTAENASHLEGQSLNELRQAIIDAAIAEMAERSGYMRLFKKLHVGEESLITHNLKNQPLVDAYQLDYFLVVASEDDYKFLTWVNFYLYHSGEKRIRFVPEAGSPLSVEIEPSRGQAYRIPFKEMLARYGVEYSDSSSVGEIETEFWDAVFGAPNDRFDDNQYTHSPWFDRCCREERTVKSLKQKGDWDDLWIKMIPRKTVNHASTNPDTGGTGSHPPAPVHLKVAHFDFDSLGVKLLQPLVIPPIDPEQDFGTGEEIPDTALELFNQQFPDWRDELKLMLLLRA